ncbi:MAG: acyltransferase family protein [Candidatus Bathyarchaeota archaeon]|nr:acyltransferase family protein [Candidatus Bathyarchaeota archaeon]
MEPKRADVNYNVDIIRVTAIALVILLHCSNFPYKFIDSQMTLLDAFNWFTTNTYAAFGALGVPMFVMLTGALLLTPEKSDEPLREFYKKRYKRIGLPFIFWTVIYFAWIFLIHEQPLTVFNIVQGVLTGPHSILWYMYLLLGLYAVTPILRVLVKNLKHNLFTYLLILWFVGTVVPHLVRKVSDFNFYSDIFFFLGWVGYFLLGIYLVNSKVRPTKATAFLLLGLLGQILGDWWITRNHGEAATGFFHGYMSFGVILASIGLFIILMRVPINRFASHKKFNDVIGWISQNTLPMYLGHIIVLETLHRGLLGFYLPKSGIEILDVAMWFSVAFTLTVLLIYVLKKIPGISKLIG